jgi:phenylpyruvate tautomerase
MPLLKLETTVALSDAQRKELLASLSKIVAENISKPEKYVMISITEAAMLMSGNPGNAAFADIRSIGGLGDSVNRKLSQSICALLKQTLAIPPERIYLNFTDVDAGNWGCDSKTFG